MVCERQIAIQQAGGREFTRARGAVGVYSFARNKANLHGAEARNKANLRRFGLRMGIGLRNKANSRHRPAGVKRP